MSNHLRCNSGQWHMLFYRYVTYVLCLGNTSRNNASGNTGVYVPCTRLTTGGSDPVHTAAQVTYSQPVGRGRCGAQYTTLPSALVISTTQTANPPLHWQLESLASKGLPCPPHWAGPVVKPHEVLACNDITGTVIGIKKVALQQCTSG